jgi:hypothetical protein
MSLCGCRNEGVEKGSSDFAGFEQEAQTCQEKCIKDDIFPEM